MKRYDLEIYDCEGDRVCRAKMEKNRYGDWVELDEIKQSLADLFDKC